jgi:hypothetical protein
MPLENVIYRIGFNGDDETEFDVEPGTEESEMEELMNLFEDFLAENPDITFSRIDYIERVKGDDNYG